MSAPGRYYATVTKSRVRPYSVIRVETTIPRKRGGRYGVRYITVRRCFTIRGASRLTERLNAQEAL